MTDTGEPTIPLAIKKKRNIGLDIYRITAVLLVFLFHSWMHIQCDYGFFTPFIQMGAIYMTAFFLLSGFVLYLTWSKKDLSVEKGGQTLKRFYLKRLISILPVYYTVALLYIIFMGNETLSENLLLAPVEILLLQSSFMSIFSVSHNGGTWFVSCILFCYLLYPFIQELIKHSRLKPKLAVMFISCFILLYSPFIVDYYNTVDTYASPFYRLLEFIIGAILCSIVEDVRNSRFSKYIFSLWAVLIEHIILFAAVTVAVKMEFHLNNYMMYSLFALPLFMLMLLSMYGADFRINKSRAIEFLCQISYAFFFAQLFTWKSTNYVIEQMGMDTNLLRILISFTICLLFSVILHKLVEEPVSTFMHKKIDCLHSDNK